jgi:hypothetical protein
MNIIFGEMQEQVGMALLPILNEFSDWLATPEGQAKLQEIVDGIVAIIESIIEAVAYVEANKDWLLPMVAAIAGVTAAWNLATGALTAYKTAAGIAAVAGAAGAAGIAGAGVLGAAGVGAAAGGFMQGQTLGQQSQILAGSGFQQGGRLFGDAFQAPAPVINNNITVQTNATATAIADAINRANRASGTNLIRAR